MPNQVVLSIDFYPANQVLLPERFPTEGPTVPLKILLADDSMTAQKMGKEILTGAGYEVTAVSNGAAAAKKLAESYAVIILDINMPGYTGFELCEKIRANMASAKTPVLLTIGKMEPYE